MTKSAWLFLILTVIAVIAGLNLNSQGAQTTSFIASGIFFSALLLAILFGRRFKFDPVLR